jgi:hypothetical protein
MAVDSKICVLYLFCNGENVTNAFIGVSSSSGAPIRTLPPDFRRKDEGNAMIHPHSLVRVITFSSSQKSALFILEPHRGQVPPLNL